jgi:hypothetical protein
LTTEAGQFRLALLIAGDEQKVETPIVSTYEIAVQEKRLFRDWLME